MVVRRLLTLCLVLGGVISCVTSAFADEVRVVDRLGLVRAVRTVSGESTVVIQLSPKAAQGIRECILTNVDGLATERRVPVDKDGRCVVARVAATTWQVDAPAQGPYQVQIVK